LIYSRQSENGTKKTKDSFLVIFMRCTDCRGGYQEITDLIVEDASYFIAGGMSTPLAFTVYSTDENCFVTPQADVNFSWFN
jgi:hypothetical protein